jgi:hypothetical protein
MNMRAGLRITFCTLAVLRPALAPRSSQLQADDRSGEPTEYVQSVRPILKNTATNAMER